MLNQQFGNYKFLSVLGEGGMAIVYLAENTMLGSMVAIKLLRTEFVHNANVRNRFLAEARSMVRVSHPNIIQVLDLIDAGDIVAIVMEYVKGRSLKEYLQERGKLTDSEIETMFVQMLMALQHVHDSGYVHRDIKPSNFMITESGSIKLADFGIAKDKNKSFEMTEAGAQMGTPMYMSPEQIKSTKDVDHRSDIYSLGIVLWQMITGKLPYDSDNLSQYEIQNKIINEKLPNTGTYWDKQIAKSTQKDSSNRFQNCSEWLSMIGQKNTGLNELNNSPTTKSNAKKYLIITVSLILASLTLVYLFVKPDSKDNMTDASKNQSSKKEIVLKHQDLLQYQEKQFDQLFEDLKDDSVTIVCEDCVESYKVNDFIYKLTLSNKKLKTISKSKKSKQKSQPEYVDNSVNPVPGFSPNAYVNDPPSNVRLCAGNNCNVSFQLTRMNEPIEIITMEGQWAYFRTYDGRTGYLHETQYIVR